MPYGGSTNGGSGGMPGGVPNPGASTISNGVNGSGGISIVRDKDIAYNATVSEQILNISTDPDTATTREAIPSRVDIANVGNAPIYVLAGYKTYSSETAISDSSQTRYLHTLLMPGQIYNPPVRSIISTANASTLLDGTPLSNQAPDSNKYTDSGENCAGLANTTDPVTFTTSGPMFRVADLIRVENEVMEITAISGGDVTVKRGLFGTDPASHSDSTDIRFPFFNAYHDFDKYSVAQTDSNGKFKCFNLFGKGRAASGVQGIVPGSLALKFYNAGYQSLGLSGITSATSTALETSGSYWFKIAIDGGTAESINFTTDSNSVLWGGTNGVISKIQAALDDKYNNSASNTFQQKSTIGIVDGDIRFTSGQRLSTSAIALTAGVDGASATYNLFSQQNGHIPALAGIRSAVAARLPDDVTYDPITYLSKPNSAVFGYDNGRGRINGACQGNISYETGALDITGCPANAEFVYSVAHTSVFSGMATDIKAARFNCLIEVLANTPSQKGIGKVRVTKYK